MQEYPWYYTLVDMWEIDNWMESQHLPSAYLTYMLLMQGLQVS